MAFRFLFEPKKILGAIIGKDLNASKEEDVRSYIDSGMVSIMPENFSGNYADLLALIEREIAECERYVKERGLFRSGVNSRAACSDQINSLYSTVLIDRQGEAYSNDQQATAQFLEGNYTMYIIAAAALILIFIIILL